MNKVLVVTTFALSALSCNAFAAMDSKMEQTLVEVCQTGLSDDLHQFRTTITHHHINKKQVFPKLVCNGQNFYQFAKSNGADRIAAKVRSYMSHQVSITDLASADKDEQLSVTFSTAK